MDTIASAEAATTTIVTTPAPQTSDNNAFSPLKAHDDERRSVNNTLIAEHAAAVNRCMIFEQQPYDPSTNLLRQHCENGIDVTNGIGTMKLSAIEHQQCACDHLNEINYQQKATPRCCTINGDAVSNHHLNKRIYSWNDSKQSNGFANPKEEEMSKENILSISQHEVIDATNRDVCLYRTNTAVDDKSAGKQTNNFLACLSENDDKNYYDALISSDLDNAEIKLVESKCFAPSDANTPKHIETNSNAQQNTQPTERIQRRTRARSESDQCEFYQLRKQQMREHQHDAIVSRNQNQSILLKKQK